ncbi:MAG TPA: class III extradiol ring-cleavage dioxygenase [Alphaproteobacteria bacterium]|nr:class III extradiol ring-cleavage dioxygenase [Alphaproteobacteria bacterium]
MTHGPQTLPSFFLPHGGGPCFFMDWSPPDTWRGMEVFLRGAVAALPRPRAVVVISGHWHAPAFTAGAHPAPPLIYDYYGFPPHTYELTYPAAGAPALAADIAGLLAGAGLPAAVDDTRGLDHGVFIPFKLIYPDADIPVVPLSLHENMDAEMHLKAGQALAPLRDDNVLIVGSGMSFHNLRLLMTGRADTPEAAAFDDWLTNAATATPLSRARQLANWESAPGAQIAHPEAEHLLPLMIAAGAAGDDAGMRIYHEKVMSAPISAYRFG